MGGAASRSGHGRGPAEPGNPLVRRVHPSLASPPVTSTSTDASTPGDDAETAAGNPADTAAAAANWLALNRANWNARVPIHVASRFYDVPGFIAGRERLCDFEVAEVGDVTGRTLLHLQCHFGLDALAWARRGASVTGLDFSGAAVAEARSIAEQIGADDARFVESDVYSAVDALDGQTYDIVFTGLGALCWLPDIDRWAQTVASLVAPGGFLYLAEFHPCADILADDGRTVEFDYFSTQARVWDEPYTYSESEEKLSDPVSVEWQHGLADVVTALISAGLRIEMLHEHDFTLFARFPILQFRDGQYRFPPEQPGVPLIYSLRASKAA
jgi:SAM-dependent methyltransferase